MEESIHVVGPERCADKWIFLCPECDEDRLEGIPPEVTRLCTVEWLDGELLSGDKTLGERSCYCWQTDPYEGEDRARTTRRTGIVASSILQNHRHQAWRCIGGGGRRVDLPLCVKEKIEELYGNSEVGFKD